MAYSYLRYWNKILPLGLILACFAAGGLLLASAIASPRMSPAKRVTKHIEDVKVGDWVLAKDPAEAGPPRPHQVIALPRNWTEHLVHIQVACGQVQATRSHPFYVEGEGWVSACDLKVHDRLRDEHDSTITVEKLWTEDRPADTFNLTVEDVHTYYVLAGDTSVLVHNLIVVTPGGTAIPVPNGAAGPVPIINPGGATTGFKFTGGSGGYGMNSRVTTVRIMDPTLPNAASPGYPNGNVTYENAVGQGVNPATGRTIPDNDPMRHIPCD